MLFVRVPVSRQLLSTCRKQFTKTSSHRLSSQLRSNSLLRTFSISSQQLSNESKDGSRATFEPKNFSNDDKGDLTFEFKMDPIPRPNETTEAKRARLLYQSRKRGILESDLILSKFASLYLKDMTLEELVEYDKLLDENDWDIYYWVTKNEDVKPCPEEWKKSKIMIKLQEMVKNHGRECIRMPDLY